MVGESGEKGGRREVFYMDKMTREAEKQGDTGG